MRRLFPLIALSIFAVHAWGCGPQSTLPSNPTTDVREAEVKEADDKMAEVAKKKLPANRGGSGQRRP
jgi:hypothetical protein